MKKKEVNNIEIIASDYNGNNGIMIYCRSCGKDIEETDNGYYDPISYEHEKYDRKCKQCRES
jgi:hypothetical protein